MERNETEIKLLNIINKNPEQPQKRLSESIGISVGKVNYVLTALSKKGIIKTERFFNSKLNIHNSTLLSPDGIKEKAKITAEFVKRKMTEYEKLLDERDDGGMQ